MEMHKGKKKYRDRIRGWKEQMVELCSGVKICVEEYSCVEGTLRQQESLSVITTSCPLQLSLTYSMFKITTMFLI